MNERKLAFLGLLGSVVAYLFVGISIVLSPWFDWKRNALSDLSYRIRSNVAQFSNSVWFWLVFFSQSTQ